MIWSKFHTEGPQILDTTIQNLVIRLHTHTHTRVVHLFLLWLVDCHDNYCSCFLCVVGIETIQHGCHGYSSFCEAEESLSIEHSCLFCNETGLVMSNGIRLAGELWRYKQDQLITVQYKRFLTHCRRATQKCVIALPCVVDGSRISAFSYTTSCTCVCKLVWLTFRAKFIDSLKQDAWVSSYK